MAGLLTSDQVLMIDRRRGLEVQTFRSRLDLVLDQVHALDESALRKVEKEIVVAIEELHTDARVPVETS